MKRYAITLLTITFLNLPLPLFAGEPVVLEKGKGKYHLGLHLEILEDPGKQMTWQEATSPASEHRWHGNKTEIPNFAYSRSAYWLRLKIKNPFQEQKKMLLEVAWPLHDYIDAYIENAGVVAVTKTGDWRPISSRQKKHRHFLFDVQLPPGQVVPVLLRFQSHDGLHEPIPLVLWESDAFMAKDTRTHYFLGILMGILAVMAAYNMFIYFYLRDLGYLYYVISLLGYTVWLSSFHGFSFLLLWPDSPWWANQVIPLSASFAMLHTILFTRSFLDTVKNAPKLDIFFKALTIPFLINLIIALFGLYAGSLLILIISIITLSVALLAAGGICLMQGHRPAMYYLLAFVIASCGGVMNVLKIVGLFPANFITENFIFIGFVLMVVLLSLGLADRINAMREENDAAREHALRIKKKGAEKLEILVKERTRKLAQANEQLQQMDRAKSRFFANISHEFRTPLTLILAPVESIWNGAYGESISKSNAVFQSIMQNGARLLRLINNLLDFSKIEAGRMAAKKQRTDIVKLLEYYTSSVQSGFESKGLQISFTDNSGGLIAFIDRDLMEKAIMNLLSNAFKFTPAGGEIFIQLDKIDAARFAVSVKDTGIGVTSDKLDTIFQRFSQADESTSRKYEGTGIGLSLTREIAELHGGTVTVNSAPGEGSVFTMTLDIGNTSDEVAEEQTEDLESIAEMKSYLLADLRPSFSEEGATATARETNAAGATAANANARETNATGANAATATARETNAAGATAATATAREKEHRILMVEDNPDMRAYLKMLLEPDYIVHAAANGKEGLERATEVMPALILSDVMMPEMDGLEMTRVLKSDPATRDIPVILLSAKADVLHRIEGLEFGADDYLSKPFHSGELLVRIRNQIESKRLERVLKNEKRERDMEFLQASQVQKTILTSRAYISQIAELEIDFAYLPMNGKISGDYYNISRMNNGVVSVFLADATGHGTQAALSTMQIDILYRESLDLKYPDERFYFLNNKFASEIRSKNYFTGIIVDIDESVIRYSSAGHPDQYLLLSGKKDVRMISTGGKLVGLMQDQKYETEEIEIEKGDILLLFTDGIAEAFNSDREEFGEERLLALVRSGIQSDFNQQPMDQVIESIIAGVERFRNGESFRDDVTLIGIRFR